MEVGAVKQAFNNELILMKKKLNQAKTQVIHKLTRKAKTLTEKKVPDKLKEKLNKKAESAVKEVLIIKKIKAKDIAKFMITHTEELSIYLNRPIVDQDKACARLALHKAMQDKYKFIRGRFGNVPIKDLFMSRQERIKLKKEAREKQKNKKKGKEPKKIDNSSEWKIEDINTESDGNNLSGNEDKIASSIEDDNDSNIEQEKEDSDLGETVSNMSVEEQLGEIGGSEEEHIDEDVEQSIHSENEHVDSENVSDSDIKIAMNPIKMKNPEIFKNNLNEEGAIKSKNKNIIKKPEKKVKGVNKNKNFKEKILHRKFKRDAEDSPFIETKVVDSFFITSTGEKYMSVAEPRQPDEFKEIHKQGNRKFRRAVMFGHVPKIKPKQDHIEQNSRNGFNKSNFGNKFNSGVNNKNKSFNDRRNNLNDKTSNFNNNNSNVSNEKPEKLHPSWEAKKRQSGILPFQGKKIVFDES